MIETNGSFVYPHPPKDGHVWWSRPTYVSSRGKFRGEISFSWGCAFCGRIENNGDNYAKVGYVCPECLAVFIGDNSFGTWQAKEVPKEWAEGRHESWM